MLKLTKFQYLALGFITLILIGTVLLCLPISLAGDGKISFIDALFTATSAVTTTGLIVVDTGTFFSPFGQLVILSLIQIGGLGYMIFIVMLLVGLRQKLSFDNVELLHESIPGPSSENLLKFFKKIIIFTVFFETLGAVLLTGYWQRFFPLPQAIYTGIFHSVSAFCTAGFSLYSDSFTAYRDSIFFNASVILVCIAGSIGFFVLNDLYHFGKKIIQNKYPRNFSAHTKLALTVMCLLIISGIIISYFGGGEVAGRQVKAGFLYSIFQIVSAVSTTGFNTVDITVLNSLMLWLIIILMFIGCCPGGTGGGIKTTTFGLMLLAAGSVLTGKKQVNVFHRRVLPELIMKAFTIALIALLWIICATATLLISDPKLSFLNILFEVVSAFGTIGLSAGITSSLSMLGKIMISLTMLLGRVGPIAIGYSLVGKPKPVKLTYPNAEILVG